jgi:hypothetical protein
VPSALVSVLELEVSRSGLPALGYFAQVPHYVAGPYPSAALELLRSLGRHLDLALPEGDLPEESRALRAHLDSLATGDSSTRAYVERLESMVDEERLPSGDDLIEEIERFLRDGGTTTGARLRFAFARALQRAPTAAEERVLVDLLRKGRGEFGREPEAARRLVATGQAPVPEDLPAAELGAWTQVARAILNLPQLVTRS